mmetsp:Transcript_84479/g.273132  ORF Transcript_84479/g.273132 Transcript_84479/m.273132 type:complete len:288 (+) Transcript_84479:90-953(+)
MCAGAPQLGRMVPLLIVSMTVVVHVSARVPLIIDTDIGGGGCQDVDDVAAICMAHALADNGEAELLAIVQDTQPPACAGAISVLNHFYGRDDLPIGAYRGEDLTPSLPHPYVDDLVANWSSPIKNTSQVPDAVHVYRRVLSAQRDHSVVISSVGLLTNLKGLLKSAPDEHSHLSGRDLVARKVAVLAVMGGAYPSSGALCECNFCALRSVDHQVAVEASAYVVKHMPPEVKIIFSGFEVGVAVQSGAALSSCAPESNPCRRAYINYEGGLSVRTMIKGSGSIPDCLA